MVRRHPHVFGDVTVSGADQVKRNWGAIKRQEKAERARGSAAGQSDSSARTACPSASPPWRWPHSYSGGRSEPGCPKT